MDEHRIDRIARGLGRRVTRRAAVGGASGVMASVVAGAATHARQATPSATEPKMVSFTPAACLGFTATIVSGPNAGASWTGDLMMQVQADGFFTALLVPPEAADHQTLRITDPSKAIAQATGQVNGASIDWFLYVGDDRTVFGHGMIEVRSGELRGTVSGWDPADVGVFHGSNRPPFIRIVTVCCEDDGYPFYNCTKYCPAI